MTAVAPFFPRYMFIVLDPERIGLVMQGDRAQPLAWDRQDTCCLDGNGRPPAIAAATAVGDSVQLSQGPFAEYLGTFDRLDDSDRVRVSPTAAGFFLVGLGIGADGAVGTRANAQQRRR
jgi:transcription antitermination factor NusG